MNSRQKAIEFRDRFGYFYTARFPVHEVAAWYRIRVNPANDPEGRVMAAQDLGKNFRVDDPEEFAVQLLAPLHLVEPICIYGRVKTGEKTFFGFFEKKRGYTTNEMAQIFDVPIWMMRSQIGKLL